MTIDEAIENLKYDVEIDMYIRYIAPKLAEWLEDYKRIKMLIPIEQALKSEYNKAIDDFVKEICKMIIQSEKNGNYRFYAVEIKQAIVDLAEQLKAGAEE